MKIPRSTHPYLGRLILAAGATLFAAFAARADYNSVVLGDTPLAFYAINTSVSDSTQTIPDLSGNGNDAPAYNIVPAIGPSSFLTNAAAFDGSDSQLDLTHIANPGLLNFSGPITLEAWVQPVDSTVFGDIIAKGYDQSLNFAEIVLRANGNADRNVYYGAPGGGAAVSGGVQSGNWTHLVLSSDGTTLTLYVNNVAVQSTGDTSGALNFADGFAVGTGSVSGQGRYFHGNITEAAIYNHGLTAAQVQNHYFQGLFGVTNLNASVPIISAQPQAQSAYLGGAASFTFQVINTIPYTNQWLKGGVPIPGQTNANLFVYNLQAADFANYSVIIGNANGTTNSAVAALTQLATGNSLKWTGANNNTWDIGSTANFVNTLTSSTSVFNTADQVLFDDSVGAPTNPMVSGSVNPSIVTFNTANGYILNNNGTVNGPANFLKQGSGTVTIQPGPHFTGGIVVTGGTLVAGNNSIGTAAGVVVTNNSSIDLSGGTLSNGKPFVLSGAGDGGKGALYNGVFQIFGQILEITLAGDATLGELGGNCRWDLAPGSTISGAHKITINFQDNSGYSEWDTVNIGREVGDIEITQGALGLKGDGLSIGNPANTITADSGTQLIFWNSSVGTNSGYAKNIHVLTNGIVAVRTSPNTFMNANYSLDAGAEWDFFNGSGSGITMNGTIVLNGPTKLQVGDSTVTVTNVISGPGGFVWQNYNNLMVFTAANTYTGPTVIGNGRNLVLSGNGSISHSSTIFFGGTAVTNIPIDVTGRPDHTLTLTSGQTLAGNGTVNGSLTVSSGATITPAGTNTILGITLGGNAIGTLAASTNVTLGGTTIIKLNGSGVNDVIQADGNIAYGGVLSLNNISGSPLAAGNSFQVFNSATRSGSFASVTPTTPGSGLTWDLSQINSGIVTVVAVVQPLVNSTKVSGTNFILSGINGKANGNFVVYATTNINTPFTNWVAISTNTFDGTGAFHVTNGISPTTPRRFFRLLEQ